MFVHENSCLIKIINNMIECTINGKSAALNLSNEQLQVLVSGNLEMDAYLLQNVYG